MSINNNTSYISIYQVERYHPEPKQRLFNVEFTDLPGPNITTNSLKALAKEHGVRFGAAGYHGICISGFVSFEHAENFSIDLERLTNCQNRS